MSAQPEPLTAADLAQPVEQLTDLVERMADDRMVLLRCVKAVAKLAQDSIGADVSGPDHEYQWAQVLKAIETTLRGLSVPQCLVVTKVVK